MTIDQSPADQPTEAVPVPEVVRVTMAPPYDPKAVFFEEWSKIVDPELEDTGTREEAWRDIRDSDQKEGNALEVVPESAFRMISKAIAHAWVASALARQGKEHTDQADALRVLYSAELRALCGAECGALDVGAGLLRKCAHDHSKPVATKAQRALDTLIGQLRRAIGTEEE